MHVPLYQQTRKVANTRKKLNCLPSIKKKSIDPDCMKSADQELSCLYPQDVLYDFLVTVKAASHECIIRTGQP